MYHEYFIVPEKYIDLVVGKKSKSLNCVGLKFDVQIFNIDNEIYIYSKESADKCLDAKNHIVKIYRKKILEQNECAICLEKIDTEKNFVVTKCGHNFHSDCLIKALEKNNKCPMCREQLKENNKKDIDNIINKTIRLLRQNNYFMHNLTFIYYYMYDVFSFQVIMEEILREPLRYALNQFNN